MAYVKYSDIADSVARITDVIESEQDTRVRSDLVVSFVKAVSQAAGLLLERQAYDMKTLGVPSDIIATELGISQRAVLRLIRRHSQSVGLNPMDRIHVESWFDIRDFVDLSE
jgi:Tfp pilus assembly pilus retraction ATPase PilT